MNGDDELLGDMHAGIRSLNEKIAYMSKDNVILIATNKAINNKLAHAEGEMRRFTKLAHHAKGDGETESRDRRLAAIYTSCYFTQKQRVAMLKAQQEYLSAKSDMLAALQEQHRAEIRYILRAIGLVKENNER